MGFISGLFGVGDTSAPSPVSSGFDAASLMQALIGLQPQAFGAQSTYGPQYTNLTGQEIGSAGTNLSDLIAQYLPGLTTATNTANTAAGTAAVGNAATLGPQAAAAISATNPAQAATLAQLNDTALSGLKAGSTLAPQDTSNITSAVRNNWSSRGLGDSGPASLDEALQLYAGGQSALSQRQTAAGQAVNLDNSVVTQPSLALSQVASSAPGLTNNILGQAEGVAGPSGNTLTDPTSILSGAYNANAAANITSANNSAALNWY